MKKLFVLFVVLGVALTSCKDAKKKGAEAQKETKTAQKSEGLQGGKYLVNVDKSVVKWKGFKLADSHDGTIAIDNGYLNVKDGKVVGGNFTIDMESIKVLDIPADDKYNGKLVGHLKNADFFEVDKFKTASFKITSVAGKEVEGVLTIKEVSKPIKFEATLTEKDGALHFASEKVVFDRTEFGIKYKSKKFFDSLKDKFIKDDVEISFDVVAVK